MPNATLRANAQTAHNATHEAALRQWEADKERSRAESGVDDAHAAEGEALEAVTELQERLAETPARTLAGLIFKARYAAQRDYDPVVMQSIIDDLLAMDGEA